MAAYYSDYCNEQSYVYRIYSVDGELLYVGLALRPESRVAIHRSKPWGHRIAYWDSVTYPNRWTALAAENEAIATEHPTHNIYRPKGVANVT